MCSNHLPELEVFVLVVLAEKRETQTEDYQLGSERVVVAMGSSYVVGAGGGVR